MIRRVLHHITRVDDPIDENPDYASQADVDERLSAVNADRANVVSSRVDELGAFTDNPREARCRIEPDVMHAPVLDIDYPVFVIPSSTAGHYHLYLEKPVRWDAYEKLLEALAECGLIEGGYAHASIARGATYVRVPTCVKGEKRLERDTPRVPGAPVVDAF